MPEEQINLPPLPDPEWSVAEDYGWRVTSHPRDESRSNLDMFTADQMTAYALLAVKQERELMLTRFDDVMTGCGIGRADREYMTDKLRKG